MSNTISRFRIGDGKCVHQQLYFVSLNAFPAHGLAAADFIYSRHGCILTKAKLLFYRTTPGDTIARICTNSSICFSLVPVLAYVNYKWNISFRLSSVLHLVRSHRYFDITPYELAFVLGFSCHITKIFFSSMIYTDSIGKLCTYNKSARYSRQFVSHSIFLNFIYLKKIRWVEVIDKNYYINYILIIDI